MTVEKLQKLSFAEKLKLLTPEEKCYLLGYIDRILFERKRRAEAGSGR